MKKLDYSGAISNMKRGLLILGAAAFLAMLNPATSLAANTATAVQQAKVKVKGTVTDQTKSPVIGASVSIKGSTNGMMTDIDGKFSLDVPAGSTLTVSGIGFKPQTVKVTQAATINIVLENENVSLEQVVVVGFGTQKKENLTGAVSSVDARKALDSKPITNLDKGLQGVTPGLTITYGNGNLASSASINVRGTGTLISGKESGSPLVLVDGIPTDLSLVNPEDVANISVLKDAASASIYGARGAFGVILITTKNGKSSDRIKVSFTSNIGFSNPTKLTEFMDPEKEIPGLVLAQQRRGLDPESFGMNYSVLLPGIINWRQKYANNRTSNEMVYGEDWEIIKSTPYFYRVWDPNKMMIVRDAPQQSYNIQATGKVGENTSFMVSVGYSDQKGMMKINQDELSKYSTNFGLTTQLAKWLKADFKVLSSIQDYKEPYNYYSKSGVSGDSQQNNGYFGYYMRWGQFFPYGTYKGTYFRHAPGFMANANMNDKKTNYVRYSTSLVAEITKDLKFTTEYSVGNQSIDYKLNGGAVALWDFWSGLDPNTIQTTAQPTVLSTALDDRVAESKSTSVTQVVNAYFNYNKKFAESHNVSAMLGVNTEWNKWERTYSERRGLMDRNKPEFNLANGDLQYVTSAYDNFYPGITEYALAGVFARLNYAYKAKYLIELNGRFDGSSRFPTNQQWGFFPSASIGYRITQEPFMEPVKSILTDAKLRASIGSIGNQNIEANAFVPTMGTYSASWINGTTKPLTAANPKVVSPDLTWEKVVTTDLGFDARIIDMFGINVDWYQRNTSGMLAVGKALPTSFGASAPKVNAGNLRTRGLELSFDFNKRINSNIAVYANLTLSNYETVVTKWDNPNKGLNEIFKGKVLGDIWGLKVDRLYQESDFTKNVDAAGKITWTPNVGILDQSSLQSGTFKFGPGDVKYKDLNGDGKINGGKGTLDDHGDLVVIGSETPKYQYGVRLGGNFYGFDLDMFFQGVGERKKWSDSNLILPCIGNNADALYGDMDDYWTPTNTNAFYPNPYTGSGQEKVIPSIGNGSNNFVANDRYITNLAYLRLKNLTIGYTIPSNLTSKVKIEKVRVYFSGQNLTELVDSRLSVDPEINATESSWGRTYPYQRTYSFGLQVNF